MKIVILGAGRVGESAAESLVLERNDITVIDTDPARLRALQERLDLRTVVGNGIQPSVLREAGVDDADMLIACAAQDETNLVVCKVAHDVFNVPTTWRASGRPSSRPAHRCSTRAASRRPGDLPRAVGDGLCAQADRLPRGAAGAAVRQGPGLIGGGARGGQWPAGAPQSGRDSAASFPMCRCASSRSIAGHVAAEPGRQHAHRAGDEVFLLAATTQIRRVLASLGKMDRPVKRVMIAGGGRVGLRWRARSRICTR
jgi:trk system potassium uptake protein TrkA